MSQFGPVHVDLAALRRQLGDLVNLITELEARQVKTICVPDYQLKVMMEIREDTNEVIATRPLTIKELNADLPFEG